MKRVGAQYLKANGQGTYAYDVWDSAKLGDLIFDKHSRIAVITALGSSYDGPVLQAWDLKGTLEIRRSKVV